MQTIRALTVPGLIATLCAGFACSSPDGGDQFFPTSGGSTSSGSTPGMGTGSGTAMGTTGGTGTVVVTGNSGSTSMAGNGGVEKCTGTSQGTTPLPPLLEFLIDYSQSMDQTPMGQTEKKYVATAKALEQAFTDMVDGTGTGLIFYPNTQQGGKGGGTATCINKTEAEPLAALNATVRQNLIAQLQAKRTSGNTPTHDAFVYAVDTIAASPLMGNKYVVVVTDGSPTFSLGCVGDGMTPVDTAPLVQAAADANTMRGIKTFVIGSPGSEAARASLSAMATQGGTAPPGCSDAGPTYCHFDMTTAPDLSAALNAAFKAITGSVITCNYTIPPPGNGKTIDPNLVNVNFTSSAGSVTDIKKDQDPGGACNSGWNYNADKTQILLCPDTCDLVKADPMAKVNVVLGCTNMPL